MAHPSSIKTHLTALRRDAAVACVVMVSLAACDPSDSRRPARTEPVAAKPKAPPGTEAARSSAAPSSTPTARSAPREPRAPAETTEAPKDDQPTTNSRYLLDGLNDVGPAAPASAFAEGVVMISRTDELVLARLLQPPSKSKKPTAGALQEITMSSHAFWPVARGPATSPTHAYWVSKGRLVRRAFAGGELEVLTRDARDGTRVAVSGSPDVVAYITAPADKQDSQAKLRLPDGRLLLLTPEGAAASSVSLTRVGDDVLVSYIDGRSGMTPVHARRLRLRSGELDPDVVVWVSGATQGMTEISSVGSEAGGWLLLPVERDSSRFGLATLLVDRDPKMDPPLRWRTYPNGLDRSPAAAAVLCGRPTAVYVRPLDARPGAHQELVISDLTLDETATSEQLATARGFSEVSLHPLPEGALLAYVADRRTWARLIRCK